MADQYQALADMVIDGDVEGVSASPPSAWPPRLRRMRS